MGETPATYLPDYFPQRDVQPSVVHSTVIMRALSGREQRRAQYPPSGLRRWAWSSNVLTQSQRAAFRAFYNARRGNLQSFWMFAPLIDTVTNFAAGNIAVAATSFIVPGRGNWWGNESSSSPAAATYSAVTVGGVSKAVTATPNIGTGGEDRISWTGSQAGAVILSAVNFRERIVCRFDIDALSARLMQDAGDPRHAFQIAIQELVP